MIEIQYYCQMTSAMATPEPSKHEKRDHMIELSGISDELLKLLDRMLSQTGSDQSGYILELLRKDLLETPHPEMTFEQILSPVHRYVQKSHISEKDLEELFENEREEVWQEYKKKSSSFG